MIKKLRKLDYLYFGNRVGKGSAFHFVWGVITGFIPLEFAKMYWNRYD